MGRALGGNQIEGAAAVFIVASGRADYFNYGR